VNITIIFGVCIAMFRSVPSGPRVCSRIRAGRFGVAGERSYRLQLCPGEAFEASSRETPRRVVRTKSPFKSPSQREPGGSQAISLTGKSLFLEALPVSRESESASETAF